jgi:creatinine deaminase
MDEFMKAAIEEAEQGRSEGGIPIGSVLVQIRARVDRLISRWAKNSGSWRGH